MEKLALCIPAYNEEANIACVLEEWNTTLKKIGITADIFVADSGSTDKTHTILLALQKEMPNLHILSETQKEHGPKVLALYRTAIEHKASFIFQTDSDGQTSAQEFSAFWNIRNEYDAILGVRKHRQDGAIRAFVEKSVCILLRLYFGIHAPDANAPFRLMKTDVVAKYIERLPKNYNLPNILFTTFFLYYKENVLFKEISFKKRSAGKNSINIPRIAKIGFRAISDFKRFKEDMKNEQ